MARHKQLTLRAGYRHTSPMIGSQDVTLNVLAPAITEHHVTGGFKYELTKNSSIDFAAVYAFKNSDQRAGDGALHGLRLRHPLW